MGEEKDKNNIGYGEVVKSLVKDKVEAKIIDALLQDEDLNAIIEEVIGYKKDGK